MLCATTLVNQSGQALVVNKRRSYIKRAKEIAEKCKEYLFGLVLRAAAIIGIKIFSNAFLSWLATRILPTVFENGL